MPRDIFSIPIARNLLYKLVNARLTTVEDLRGISVEKLCSEAGFSSSQAAELLELLKLYKNKSSEVCFRPSTCIELLNRNGENPPIRTSSKQLDDLLGGGIPLRKLTEICGIPGSGKTQLCLQLAVNVQKTKFSDGSSGEAFYLDTEGGFNVQRLKDMARPADVQEVLRGVHYYRCLDYPSLLNAIHSLQDFLLAHPKVRLVVVDNIVYHFRNNADTDYGLRTRSLRDVALTLAELAERHAIAVVLTNQMTTRIGDGSQKTVVPSLGDSWSHMCCTRLVLNFDGGVRSAVVVKSSYRPLATAQFQIELAGIRDVSTRQQSPTSSAEITSSQYQTSVGVNEEDAVNDDLAESDSDLGAAAKRRHLDTRDST